ncbi:Protein TTR-44 a [Aphelenchoides avenae]|nr:Protein TTR-44 a [Aphelenchus avenae]KAH7715849.1 Protein TTR-44 a [Aphelenchus avenae]
MRLASALGKQTVGAKGRLLCGSKPSAGTLVKLWDEDTGPDPDDLMAKTNTDSNGDFQLSGSESEIGNIDPWLKIYHNCNNKWSICLRKIKYKIPSSYIASGDSVKQWFELGTINLEPKQPGEETECIPG